MLVLVAAAAEAAYAAINMLALQVFVKDVLNLTAYLGVILGAFLLVEALDEERDGRAGGPVRVLAVPGNGPIISGCTALLIASLGWWVRGHLTPITTRRQIPRLPADPDGAGAAGDPARPRRRGRGGFLADDVRHDGGYAPEHRRTSAMSTLTVAYMAGVACGPLLAGWANNRALAGLGSRVVTEVQVDPRGHPTRTRYFYLEGHVRSVDPEAQTLALQVDDRNLIGIRRHRILRIKVSDATEIRMRGEPAALEEIRLGVYVRLKAEGNKIAAFIVVGALLHHRHPGAAADPAARATRA